MEAISIGIVFYICYVIFQNTTFSRLFAALFVHGIHFGYCGSIFYHRLRSCLLGIVWEILDYYKSPLHYVIMYLKCCDRMSKNVDLDQTASLGIA